jgi:peptidoglycan-associated lipoprotein
MFSHRPVFVVAPLAFALFASGCGSDKPPVKAPDTTAQGTTTTPSATAATNDKLPTQAPDSPTASAVRISDEILKACGIKAADAYFAFDSSRLDTTYTGPLDQVATCFTSGPLKGRTVKLVGHADPRGTSEYNMTLGQKRADEVSGYLGTKGLDKAKRESSTRGALDASGTDEPSWARDRRVDVMLGQ